MKLNSELIKLLKQPTIIERYAAAGLEPRFGTPEQFGDLLKREVPRWKQVAKAIDLKLD
jgi:tripartite-type tricarboxylate transporter receptor subunit TctC